VAAAPQQESGDRRRSELWVDVMRDGTLRLAGASISEDELEAAARGALAKNPDVPVVVANERGDTREELFFRIVARMKAAGAKRVGMAPGRSKR